MNVRYLDPDADAEGDAPRREREVRESIHTLLGCLTPSGRARVLTDELALIGGLLAALSAGGGASVPTG